MNHKQILIADPHGFCAGVRRAIESVEAALTRFESPVYCLHEIVHNRQVVDRLASLGVIFVEHIDQVPPGKCLIFSAHGVAPAVREAALQRRLRILDATCPFVSKLHAEVRSFAAHGCTVLLIGYRGHDEIVGICGEAPESVIVIENQEEARSVTVPDPAKMAVVTQTTLSVDETAAILAILKSRFPSIRKPHTEGICRATMNRQEAVKLLARRVKTILVLGSRNSSNTQRLAEVACAHGAHAILVDSIGALKAAEIDDAPAIGITAGASTPEEFLEEVLRDLRPRGFDRIEDLAAAEERLHFPLPKELR